MIVNGFRHDAPYTANERSGRVEVVNDELKVSPARSLKKRAAVAVSKQPSAVGSRKTCKDRPRSQKGDGTGRPFIPYCKRKS